MVKQSTAETQDWDDERIALRIRLRLAEERGTPLLFSEDSLGGSLNSARRSRPPAEFARAASLPTPLTADAA